MHVVERTRLPISRSLATYFDTSPGAVTTFLTASRAHLRRARPTGPGHARGGCTGRARRSVELAGECRAVAAGMVGSLAAGGGAAWPAASSAIAHRRGPLPAAPLPRTRPQRAPRRNAPWVMRSASWPGRSSRARCASRRSKGQLTRPERRALSGPAPPASRALPSVASPGRWAQAPTLDPGAPADPAGLTARARPEARPERRAANLHKPHLSEGRGGAAPPTARRPAALLSASGPNSGPSGVVRKHSGW